MSQQDVIDFLEGHKGQWFSTREIAEALDLNEGSIRCSLKRLHRGEFVAHRRVWHYRAIIK